MYAYHMAQADRCPRCKVFYDEWVPGKGGNPIAYLAEARRCPGCERIDVEKHDWEQGGGGSINGVSIHLVRNPNQGAWVSGKMPLPRTDTTE